MSLFRRHLCRSNVTDGHEVPLSRPSPPVPSSHRRAPDLHERHERQILTRIVSTGAITQRSLASELGIALGLTNLLIRRLVKKGWVKTRRISPRRVRYLITPAGLAAQARLTRDYFLNSLTFYRESRDHVRARLAVLAAELRASQADQVYPVVFYGAGEVSEVAYVCLQEAGLELVGVVDGNGAGRFFQVRIHDPADLSGTSIAAQPFARLIVMPFQEEERIRQTLTMQQVPPDIVFWL